MSKKRFQPNTTQTPNIIFDFFMTFLSGAEFKVLMFFVRQTYGFHRYNHVGYAMTQIADGLSKNGEKVCFGTGLSKDGVRKAVDILVEYGILHVKRGDFIAKQSNTYALAFDDEDFDLKQVCIKMCTVLKISTSTYEKYVPEWYEKEVPTSYEKNVHLEIQAEIQEETSSDYKKAVEYYFNQCKLKGITKPEYASKEGKELKYLLKTYTYEKLISMMDIWFSKEVGKWSGYAVCRFRIDINKIQLMQSSIPKKKELTLEEYRAQNGIKESV